MRAITSAGVRRGVSWRLRSNLDGHLQGQIQDSWDDVVILQQHQQGVNTTIYIE